MSHIVHSVVHEEFIAHGEKGLTIKFFHKEGKEVMKVVIVKKPEGFMMKTTMGGKTSEATLSKTDLVKELKKHKQLKFAVDFVESAKNLARPKRSSRKAGSKKGSKRSSRKVSRSKRTSRKGSRKGSKKSSRK